jgi:hypothetical protein
MKNKFILTEEESKRILSLHKEKIDQERNVVSEMTEGNQLINERWEYKIKGTYNVGCPTGGDIMIKPDYVFVYNQSKDIAVYYDEDGNKDGYFDCKNQTFNQGGNKRCKHDVLSGYILRNVCKRQGGGTTPPPTPTKKGCPSIVKSFTDAGYTQITVERYKELANDTTRIRRYRFCPVTKKNLYFAKMKQSSGTNTGGTNTGETIKGGGGQTYPFDYETILKAFPPDEIINPFEQGGEEEVQSTIVTDKMYAEF